MGSKPECPGCDYASGRICDDCLELIERRLDASDVLGGVLGCLLILVFIAGIGAVLLGWR